MTVVNDSGAECHVESSSPVPRHRGQPFASIPEDHALDSDEESQTEPYKSRLSTPKNSRCASPAPSWDFSQDDSSECAVSVDNFEYF